jgi:CarD family transcriptional regulator
MPSTKKTKKAAKPAASRAKTSRSKSSMAKATTRSKSKTKKTTARTNSAQGTAKSASKARTAARGGSKASASAARIRSVAKASAKSATKTAQVKTAAKASKTEKTRAASKAASAKASVTKTAVQKKAAKTKAAATQVIQQKAKKPVESRGVAVKETSPEKIKTVQQKASPEPQNDKIARLKPVQPTAASPDVAKPKLVTSKAAAPVAAAPVSAKTAPESRPASAPAVQPRDTSEQIPVTQKKIATPISAAKPFKPASKPPAAAPVAAPASAVVRTPKPTGAKLGFKTNEHVVYPAHGVGQIVAIEEQEVAGFKLELFVISFVKDKMILKVPTPKVVSVGMRKLAEPHVITRSLDTLTGRARIKRTMWSRRAQEYEAKINSGDLIAIAEVVRDLYRSEAQPEQSYSERQLYEAALDRMSRELSVVQKLTEQESLKLIDAQLQKGPRRGAKADAEAEADGEAGDVDEAA